MLGRIAVLHRLRPVATDGVASAVCLSATVVSPATMAEPIEMPFGAWTRVDRRKQMFNRIRQVAPIYAAMGGHIGAS